MVYVEYSKEQPMVKNDRELSENGAKVPNELFGQVTKTVGVQGQTNVSYTNKMQKDNPDFVAQPLKNQEYLDAQGQSTEATTNVVRYKSTGTESFRVFPNDGGIKTTYYVNGVEATDSEKEIIRRNKVGNGGKPTIMNIGLRNITKINADGKQIELL